MMTSTSDMSGKLREFLMQHTTAELPKLSKLITIPSNADLPTAFSMLVENKILSAPVFDVATNNFVGFLDTRDLLAFCVFAADEKNVTPSLDEVISVGIKRTPVALDGVSASYLARRHPFAHVKDKDPLDMVVDLLGRRDIHRVPVVGDDGSLVSIISQSVIVNFLYKHREELKDVLSTKIEQLEIGSSPVITVPKSQSAAETFSMMDKKGFSGLGIVDDTGVLIANTSASDIKLFLDSKPSLSLPIIDFISKIHQLDVDIPAPLVCVTKSSTLEAVLGKMAAAHVHRVFVVDEHSRPKAVISVTDLMVLCAK